MRRRLAWWGGLALVGLAAVWLLHDLVAATLAPWVARLVVRLAGALSTIPPVLIWLIFLLLLGQVLLYSAMQLVAGFWSRRRPAGPIPAPAYTPGPVEELTRWINQSERGPLFQQRLARHVSRLVLETIGRADVTAWRDAQELVAQQASALPPAVTTYLQLGLERPLETAETPQPIWQRLRERSPAGRPDPQLQAVITFLEEHMEA